LAVGVSRARPGTARTHFAGGLRRRGARRRFVAFRTPARDSLGMIRAGASSRPPSDGTGARAQAARAAAIERDFLGAAAGAGGGSRTAASAGHSGGGGGGANAAGGRLAALNARVLAVGATAQLGQELLDACQERGSAFAAHAMNGCSERVAAGRKELIAHGLRGARQNLVAG